MKKYNFSKINRLSNESAAMLSIRIVDSVSNSGIEQALNGKQYLKHAEISSRFQEVVQPRNKQAVTKAITECYNSRRDLYNSTSVYVTGLKSSPDAETAQAANLVFAALNMYGKYFGNLKIAEQSLRYIRIIEALKKPELSDALQKIQLTDKVVALDTLQRDYEDVFMGRSNNRLGIVSASDMRKELNAALKLHIEELNWMDTQYDNEVLKTLCASVDARIREINVSFSRNKEAVEPIILAETQQLV